MALLPVETALARMLEGIPPPESERVAIAAAAGRVLARDLAALHTQPPFDASAMDGYALAGMLGGEAGSVWTVIGESAAGRALAGSVREGEAVRIFTGAPVPRDCGTVVIQENVARDGNRITLTERAAPGANIRPSGGDFAKGDVLLGRGRRLDAASLMLAAAMGHGDVAVARRPVVAILATGDELVLPGTVPGADQIVSCNPVGIAALVEAAGGIARPLGIAPDRLDAIGERIRAQRDADVLVTIGGASVGDHDLIGPALSEEGIELAFWKIAMRPGKPLLYGRLGPTRVLGLPGNPASALITARVFLVPLLHALTGAAPDGRVRETAVLTAPLETNGPRLHLMRGKLGQTDGGALTVTPLRSQDSSLLCVLAEADCLIRRAPDAPALAAGDVVTVERFGG
jgi:molybdopterin molybdotransferase